ncbi:hypothetical protein [Catenibacterium sp.]|uniref:hypothetical protein n=1 Tax=Catenibacterium sp. TaxID=2049022 RepID=UPI003994B476
MLGKIIINNIIINFKRYGRPTNGKNKVFGQSLYSVELYDNSFLIDSRVFVKSRKGINFSSDFIDKAFKEYPSVSIESLLESYGLDPNKVGYHRIYELKENLKMEKNLKKR